MVKKKDLDYVLIKILSSIDFVKLITCKFPHPTNSPK